MPKSISFILNGELYYIKKAITISDLLIYFNCNKLICVLEYNGLIYSNKKWKELFIEDNSKIEIVTIVGGG